MRLESIVKYILVLLLIASCSVKINTKEGVIEVDSSYERFLLSSKFLESKEETYTRSCTKCGVCLNYMGKFGFSCLCGGTRNMKSIFDYYISIYEYRSDELPEVYLSLPEKERKLKKVLTKGSCL